MYKVCKKMEGKFYTLLKNKVFEVVDFDNVDVAVLEESKKNGFKVYKGILLNFCTIYKKSVKLEDLPTVYVVEKDGIYSHDETIKEAVKDFRYKISNRDASDFEYFKTTKEKIPTDEIIKGYRVITGACEFGTKSFVEGLGELKDSYTIDEALAILEKHNAYAFEKFKQFIKGE